MSVCTCRCIDPSAVLTVEEVAAMEEFVGLMRWPEKRANVGMVPDGITDQECCPVHPHEDSCPSLVADECRWCST